MYKSNITVEVVLLVVAVGCRLIGADNHSGADIQYHFVFIYPQTQQEIVIDSFNHLFATA